MKILGIDTSTLCGSIALIEEQALRAEINVNLGRKHTERLLPGLEWIFTELGIEPKELDAIAVGIGPGSFTGLRVGLSTAKGLALSLGIPILGISSLKALAYAVRFYPGTILAVLDARKSQVFAQFFAGGEELTSSGEPMVIEPEILVNQIPERTLLVGEGVRAYQGLFNSLKDKFRFSGNEFDYPKASMLVQLAIERLNRGEQDSLEELIPIYLRPSDAELKNQEVH